MLFTYYLFLAKGMYASVRQASPLSLFTPVGLWVTLLIVPLLSCAKAIAAEQLYTYQPAVTPELAFSGPYTVGVTTMTATDPERLNTNNFITKLERNLTLEVWYPATKPQPSNNNLALATYKNVTRLQKPFELQGAAYRDAQPLDIQPLDKQPLDKQPLDKQPLDKSSADNAQFPLILLSHGFTGYRSMMFYLGEHLASHGYVVVGIDHTHSTNADIQQESDRGLGIISTFYNRARDQQFILDFFSQLPRSGDNSSALASIVDTDRAAIIGHSMGGFGAINTVGGCYGFTSDQLKELGTPFAVALILPRFLNTCYAGRESLDKRWKAVQLLAPWGGEFDIHKATAMAEISVPTFYLAGNQDNTSGFTNGIEKLFKQTGSEHNYLLVFDNARHNIGPHPAPAVSFETDFELGHYFDPSWKTETINRVVEHMSLAFLDCHVKGQSEKCAFLPQRENGQQYVGNFDQYSDPWPGFKYLWASGLRFYRK